MQKTFYGKVLPRLGLAVCLAAVLVFVLSPAPKAASPVGELTAGKVQLQSATSLAFGPDGILFVADSMGGTVVALDTNDRTAARGAVKIDVQGVDAKIASLLGTTPDQIMVNDLTVNPMSKHAYLAVSRGRGPDAVPVIVSVDGDRQAGAALARQHQELRGQPVGCSGVRRHRAAEPAVADGDRHGLHQRQAVCVRACRAKSGHRRCARSRSRSDRSTRAPTSRSGMHRMDGLRPTAPVRTFVPYTIAGQPYILAAYTCTPLVKIPLTDLKPGAQIKPVTIADVGAGNQPLDMVPYKKDGHEFILISNSNRGVMKMNADNMGNYKAVESPEQPNPPDYIFGMPYETVAKPEGRHATSAGGCGERDDPQQARGSQNLTTIALP